MANISIASSQSELTAAFASIFIDAYSAAVNESGNFTVSLSGGSTPKILYQYLAGISLEWNKVFFFFGDERCVPPDDDESNFRMAFDAILSPLKIEDSKIFRWPTELIDPSTIASEYSKRLTEHFGGMPNFDLCLLGLGTDAHTASLFPGTEALYENEKIAMANWVSDLDAFRLTLTPPVINNSKEILFVATGDDKAAAAAAVLGRTRDPETYPAQLIKPCAGRLRWLIDKNAATNLADI